MADCKLEDADVERVVRNLNTIWRKAGIVFGIESIVHEAAVQRDRFRLIAQLNDGQIGLSDFQLLLPKPSRVVGRASRVFLSLAAVQRRLSRRGNGRRSRGGGTERGRRGNRRSDGPRAGSLFWPNVRAPASRGASVEPACPGHDRERSRSRRNRSRPPRGQDDQGCFDFRGCPQGSRGRGSRGTGRAGQTAAVVAGTISGPAGADAKKSCDATAAASTCPGER